VAELDRRRFLQLSAVFTLGAAGGSSLAGCVSFTPYPTLELARPTLEGLWDAIVPGTYRGVVEHPGPGAIQAGVQEWLEAASGKLPPPFGYITDWFLRAWADDLDLWADWFHVDVDGSVDNRSPRFGDLPLGPSVAERGRQYKVMLMTALFDGIIELQYFGAILLAKLAFYGDFRAEQAGTPRVGGPYIGFPGAVGAGPLTQFTYNRPAGIPDGRLTRTPGGLVAVP
jgi:hypothetical protein